MNAIHDMYKDIFKTKKKNIYKWKIDHVSK